MNLIVKAIKQKIKKIFYSPYRKIGIDFFTEKVIKHSNNGRLKSIHILGNKTWYKNSHELLHSLDELFFSEIYKFKATKDAVRILDCGSHIGLSILYFKTLHKKAIIKGFEPDDLNYELLSKNIKEWGFDDVSIEKSAIWTINGEVNFNQGSGMSSQISENTTLAKGQATKCIRLKDCINEEIDFLKMDIEGAEYNVLMDAEEKLGLIKNIFIEYHGKFIENNKLVKILQLLEKSGFHYYIKEAIENYKTPFHREELNVAFEVQLNIFAFQKQN